ncbi:fatty acid oxidation complex subunit alpha FadB [Aliidiomarina celeris]|uniref:fatty acid oxidation complex subunit alpha FadB n=1 Tax=Aliidiomarina celeris TaxID=2249428 RepID=UPI000DE87D40|nr:fatty acid oxidation complex subunit alpha FadB [Aliidiomarina celeris]
MIYQGDNLSVDIIEQGIAELKFDAQGSVNKFDEKTLNEFSDALDALHSSNDVQGLLVSSAKSTFIVGADITEFLTLFANVDTTKTWVHKASRVFDKLEDLPFPTIAAINGFALGGGCETILACDFRIADETAVIGLPEVKLGLIPGFGGTVRMPRLVGPDNALEAITTGMNYKPEKALGIGLVDAVVSSAALREGALTMLKDAIAGELDWRGARQPKLEALKANDTERLMSFSTAKGMVWAKAGKHYPSPHAAVEVVERGAGEAREGALLIENELFVKLTQTDACRAQVGIFLADQVVKGKSKKVAKGATVAIKRAGVLGAGIMGGGIAYQSAVKGVPVVMKDIKQDALDLGLKEASKILGKGLERGKLDARKVAQTLTSITPTLHNNELENVDIIVEAVVESPKVKSSVLAEVEKVVSEDAIITSNTSTISIDRLAESLENPSRFCGMHFFNPVHKMPLVEIIRGKHTSDETIAAVTAYAMQMGKTPIVVNDCPGFLVNRVLFPYFAGFSKLLDDGVDFPGIDKVMEKEFGWPMGPAYLCDVVGMDTADHASGVMAEGFPERMPRDENGAIARLAVAKRLGQKNGKGFYEYGVDKRGKPTKAVNPEVYEVIGEKAESADKEEIIARCMIPMVNEIVRCLEEGIVDSAEEADIALIYGLGFPPFRGGAFRYLETVGLKQFVELADKYAHLGELYHVTDGLRAKADAGESYFKS